MDQGKQAINFVEAVFQKSFAFAKNPFDKMPLEKIANIATFPELTSYPELNKTKWFNSYISTLLQRDIKTLKEIEQSNALPLMLKMLATRAGSLLNDASLARDVALNAVTYARYRTLLQLLFLLIQTPPWFRNIGKRLVKAPKIYLNDTTLLCYLLGIEIKELKKQNSHLYGNVLENFVATELIKQLTVLGDGALYHFRTYDGQEVDFVIEKRDSSLVGIEVKSRSTVTSSDFKTLNLLAKSVGKDFKNGVVIYQGNDIIPFGENMAAIPLEALWQLC